MEGSERFFLLYKFLNVEFYLQMETLTHPKGNRNTVLVLWAQIQSDSQIPVDFTSSGGEIYPCPCQSEQFWAECYDSKLNYHTVTLTEMPSSGGGTIKTKMSHKPESSPRFGHYLFLMPP